RSDEGRFPGQRGAYSTGSRGIWPQEDFITCTEHDGTAEECAADAARHALDDAVLACEPIPLAGPGGRWQ
ncbi:MAG: hypothetical protein JWM19_615, partial [Actinomycetia bacterium]|nr:hypothetical protein [Actinomycetes bacterium]